MNHRERMLTALYRQGLPDKVPHGDCMIWPEVIDAILGGETFSEDEKNKNYLFFWMSQAMSNRFFERELKVREMLGFDWTHVLPRETWVKIGENSEGHPIMKDTWGVEWLVTFDSITMSKSPIFDITKADEYQFPKVEDFSFDNLEKWVNESDLFVFVQLDSGVFKIYNILGFENCMMEVIDHKEEIKKLMERLTDLQVDLAEEALNRGADCIWLSDDHGGADSSFISPSLMWEIDFQYQKKVVDAVHKMGYPCIMHSCGNLNNTLEGMIGTGVEAIMGFQPTANNDVFEYKKQFGKEITFIGNICVTELMPHGTPWEVDQAVKRLIIDVGYDGGFVLSTCNALLSDEPTANVIAMHLAAEKYGHYPIKA